MDFTQFREKLYETLTAYVKEQLNGTLQKEPASEDTGISRFFYVPENGAVTLAFCAEDVYEFYQDGKGISEITQIMAETIQGYLGVLETKEINELTSPENIIPELIPTAGNEGFLKIVPHIPLGDIQIIFKFALPELGDTARVTVPMAYMERRGWDEKELLEIAQNNSVYKDDIRLIPLKPDISDELEGSGKVDLFFLQNLPEKMVIITNSGKSCGAASILDKEIMETIAAAFQNDLYIIPSSIHECILVSKEQGVLEELQDAVYELNRMTLPPYERLSDNIYFYDSAAKEITLASGQKEKTERQGLMVLEPQRR